jgi:hypothetical protein
MGLVERSFQRLRLRQAGVQFTGLHVDSRLAAAGI